MASYEMVTSHRARALSSEPALPSNNTMMVGAKEDAFRAHFAMTMVECDSD